MKFFHSKLALFAMGISFAGLVSMGTLNIAQEHAEQGAFFSTTGDADLSEWGIEVTVPVPDGAELKKGLMSGEIDGVTMYSVAIRKGGFKLEVNMFDEEPDMSVEEAVEQYKADAQEEDGFDSFVATEAHGFIYKIDDEGDVDYSFDYILEKGDRHIEFTTDISMTAFTMADIKAMYAAAKAAH